MDHGATPRSVDLTRVCLCAETDKAPCNFFAVCGDSYSLIALAVLGILMDSGDSDEVWSGLV